MDKRKGLQGEGKLDVFARYAALIGAALAAVGFVLTFTVAGLVNGAAVDGVEVIGGVVVANKLLLSQKIFFFHMPVAIASMVLFLFAGYYCVRFLMKRDIAYDTRAKLCMETGLVFVICTMISGEMWTRFEWGVWWNWEPRLTTYLVLMLMVIAYFVLRNSIGDPERRAIYSAVVGILILVDVPVCFMVTRLIPSSVHPVVLRADSGMSPEMIISLVLCLLGMLLIAFALYRFRLRTQLMEDKLAAIQEKLED